ncbi:MAG: photosystem II protein PsbQ [Cyanomargarita calcarea GSE-NOS-MK-12-04C]|uniref:Photosystem II protein PsbQ n=1 Tax=Cyanomargarita calcarea GSE-NOS-MK-12-04C TaxID=2839659 RepID=A0A951QU23_9CYAN|nr:photosystem II protein PsbQ [Cyanomargarita calcarea GSE-NOS-MK-12-04C]
MVGQRSFLSLILVFLATFLIGCGGPSVAKAPPTYTQAQLVQIKEYLPEIEAVRDRSQELQKLIESKEWINVGNFIHGPMTEARLTMNYVVPHLLTSDQQKARQVVRDLFEHLVKVDQAATARNTQLALSNYKAVYTDIDKFLKLLPDTSQSEAS